MTREEEILAKYKPGCICKGIKLNIILKAINNGARNFDEIASKTGIGNGPCEGVRCGKLVAGLIGKAESPKLKAQS